MSQSLPIADDHTHGFELEPLELSGPDPAKAFALEQAVELCKEIGYRGSRDPSQFTQAADRTLDIAKQFEKFLTGAEETP